MADMFRANAQLTGISSSKYDGNPHSFGASHPRFVDYSKRTGAGGGAGAGSGDGSGSSSVTVGASVTTAILPPGRAISFASLLASAAASKAAGSSDAAPAPATATGGPPSSLGKRAPALQWTAPQRLPQPFVLDRREILAAVEAALLATASATFQ